MAALRQQHAQHVRFHARRIATHLVAEAGERRLGPPQVRHTADQGAEEPGEGGLLAVRRDGGHAERRAGRRVRPHAPPMIDEHAGELGARVQVADAVGEKAAALLIDPVDVAAARGAAAEQELRNVRRLLHAALAQEMVQARQDGVAAAVHQAERSAGGQQGRHRADQRHCGRMIGAEQHVQCCTAAVAAGVFCRR